jgi:hypothetical protein
MKIEIVRYSKGVIEVIEIDKKMRSFVYKDSHKAPLSSARSIYGWDDTKKSGKEEEKISL